MTHVPAAAEKNIRTVTGKMLSFIKNFSNEVYINFISVYIIS